MYCCLIITIIHYVLCSTNDFITHADARLSFKELQQFSNRAASSRDITVRLTLLEDIRLMCGGTMTDASRYMYTLFCILKLNNLIACNWGSFNRFNRTVGAEIIQLSHRLVEYWACIASLLSNNGEIIIAIIVSFWHGIV